jgi:hypothetical protein
MPVQAQAVDSVALALRARVGLVARTPAPVCLEASPQEGLAAQLEPEPELDSVLELASAAAVAQALVAQELLSSRGSLLLRGQAALPSALSLRRTQPPML